MRSSFCRSTLNSPSWLDSRGGARRHPHPSIDVPRAGRRAPARLSTSADNSSGLTHTNSSPTNPGWFNWNRERAHGREPASDNLRDDDHTASDERDRQHGRTKRKPEVDSRQGDGGHESDANHGDAHRQNTDPCGGASDIAHGAQPRVGGQKATGGGSRKNVVVELKTRQTEESDDDHIP